MALIPKGILLFIMLFAVSVPTIAQQKDTWEYNMLRRMADHRTSSKNKLFTNLSKLNNPLCLAAPATLLVAGLASHDKTMTKKALYVTETIATAQAVTWIMKLSIGRDRPFVNDTTFIPVIYAKNKSFPSGHAAEAFSMATSLTIAYPRWFVAIPAYSWACVISYSRLYLGVHYPTDVIAGAILGSGSAWLMYKVNKWMHSSKSERSKKKKEKES